jgi:transposase
MTHPGVGPVTALATDVFLGDASRFASPKALASYVGLIPSEYSSGPRQRLGALTKQGNRFLRFLWCEAAVTAVRRDQALQRFYSRKLRQKGVGKRESRPPGSSGFGSGSCCATTSTTGNSAGVANAIRTIGFMRGCLRR